TAAVARNAAVAVLERAHAALIHAAEGAAIHPGVRDVPIADVRAALSNGARIHACCAALARHVAPPCARSAGPLPELIELLHGLRRIRPVHHVAGSAANVVHIGIAEAIRDVSVGIGYAATESRVMYPVITGGDAVPVEVIIPDEVVVDDHIIVA